jgi:(2R)-3-sulfolactate dehydrogenase (NADP+)
MTVTLSELHRLCMAAAKAAGASRLVAKSLADATVTAEAEGQSIVGVAHFFDYLDAFRAGRIDSKAVPVLTRVRPAVFHSDARGGIAQLGFDRAFARFAKAAKTHGIALFTQTNAWTCGSLGYHAERLAEKGLVAFAATNASAMIAGGGAKRPVYGTNPLAFAAPVKDGPPLLIDQSSSATAFVNIRAAAERGESVPDGWAIDRDGKPTTDPKAAMDGALLAFGGARGGNIALMVEVLSAGITGANWSLDAPPLFTGDKNSGVGMTVIAIDPAVIDLDFSDRLANQLERLAKEFGVHVPGMSKAQARARAEKDGILVDDRLLERLRQPTGLRTYGTEKALR